MAFKPTLAYFDAAVSKLPKTNGNQKSFVPTLAQFDSAENALSAQIPKSSSYGADILGGLSKADKDFISDLKSIGTKKYNLADMIAPLSNIPSQHEITEVVSKTGNPNDWAYKAAEFGGNVAPYAIGGGILDAARGSLEAAPLIGGAASYLGRKGAPAVIKRSIGNAIGGAITNPNHPIEGALEGAVLSPIQEGVAQSIPIGKNAVKKAIKYLSGDPQKLAQNINILEEGNAPVSLFDLAENQGGQRFLNNWLGQIPFSGIKKDIKTNVDNLNEHTHNFMQNLLGETGEHNINDEVKQNIINNYLEKKKIDDQNYQDIAHAADANNITINKIPLAQKLADSALNNHEALIKQKLPGNLDAASESILSNLSTAGKSSPSAFNPSISQLISTRSTLGDLASQHYKAKNTYLGKLYSDLKDALTNDIDNSLADHGSSTIQTLRKIANDYHKNEIAPYKQGNFITNLMQNQNPLGNAASIFMKGKNPVIFNDLTPELQNNIRYQLLQPKAAEIQNGKPIFNPSNILGNYKRLTAQEKNSLFTGNQQSFLNNLRQLYNINAENILSLKKPPTGFQKYGEWVKPVVGGAAGYALFHNPALLTSLAAPSLGARALNKALRSPKLIKAAISPYKKTFQKNPGIIQKAILANIIKPSNKGGNQ